MLKSHYRDIWENQDKHWWYLGMNAINQSLLDEFLPKRLGLKILDAGCGPGATLGLLQKYGDVVGIDISEEALKYARKLGRVRKGDITKLDFRTASFDLVVCMDVLYHTWVKEEPKALKEFSRVLRRGGILLVREPAYNWMRGNEDRGSLTARRFIKGDLKRKLEKAKFRVLKISYANFLLFPLVLLVRVLTALGVRKGTSDMVVPPRPINSLFFGALKLEGFLVQCISLPWGSSIVCIAKKK